MVHLHRLGAVEYRDAVTAAEQAGDRIVKIVLESVLSGDDGIQFQFDKPLLDRVYQRFESRAVCDHHEDVVVERVRFQESFDLLRPSEDAVRNELAREVGYLTEKRTRAGCCQGSLYPVGALAEFQKN